MDNTSLRLVLLLLSVSTLGIRSPLRTYQDSLLLGICGPTRRSPLREIVTPDLHPPRLCLLYLLKLAKHYHPLSIGTKEQWTIDMILNLDFSPHWLYDLGQVTWPLSECPDVEERDIHIHLAVLLRGLEFIYVKFLIIGRPLISNGGYHRSLCSRAPSALSLDPILTT